MLQKIYLFDLDAIYMHTVFAKERNALKSGLKFDFFKICCSS